MSAPNPAQPTGPRYGPGPYELRPEEFFFLVQSWSDPERTILWMQTMFIATHSSDNIITSMELWDLYINTFKYYGPSDVTGLLINVRAFPSVEPQPLPAVEPVDRAAPTEYMILGLRRRLQGEPRQLTQDSDLLLEAA